MFNVFGYIVKLFRALIVFVLSVTCAGLLRPAGPDATFMMDSKAEKYAERAKILAESYDSNFFDRASGMLHQNSNNWVSMSGCWDATSFLTMYTKLAALDEEYIKDCDAAL